MKRTFAAIGWMLAVPALAWAQEASSTTSSAPTKDKEGVNFKEIERGLNVSVGGGPYFMFTAPCPLKSCYANGANGAPFSSGQTARVEIGFDIGSRPAGATEEAPLVTVSAFLIGTANRAGSDYIGKQDPRNPASGDYTALIPGANVRINLVGFPDGQEIRRTWIYVKGGGGYVFFQPSLLLPYNDVFLTGSAGIDYFTHLRHFTVGLELAASYMISSASFGFAVIPNLRYAF
jgi:hypothetical protein